VDILGEHLAGGSAFFLLLALGLALSFEFVNGFHDTANAVATVIYTHTLKPSYAVIWSGCWNLIGVLFSTGAVAFGVLALLPVELVLNTGSGAGFAMVFALLISAIMWNLGTWYFGLPASSSHTLIGSIMGVGLANSMLSPGHVFGEGVNWAKASEVGMSLLLSPIVGFTCAALLLILMKKLIKSRALFTAPPKDTPPPLWIRGLLVLTCTGVSWAHGSNDGQKGMGLIMLILIGILPATYAVDLHSTQAQIEALSKATQTISYEMDRHSPGVAMAGYQAASDELSAYLKTTGKLTDRTFAALASKCREISELLGGKTKLTELAPAQRSLLRSDLYLTSETLGKLIKSKQITDPTEKKAASTLKTNMDQVTKFIPDFVKICSGAGTWPGNHDRLEADRRDGGGKDRQGASHLRSGRFGGTGGDVHDRSG
jgi:PiT family inorganic phosphate transporter